MSAEIISGKEVAENILTTDLKSRVEKLRGKYERGNN